MGGPQRLNKPLLPQSLKPQGTPPHQREIRQACGSGMHQTRQLEAWCPLISPTFKPCHCLDRTAFLDSGGPVSFAVDIPVFLPQLQELAQTSPPYLIRPSVGLEDNPSALRRGLREKQLEKKHHFITSTELPSLEPTCSPVRQRDLPR